MRFHWSRSRQARLPATTSTKARAKDSIEIPLFEHKFYFDEMYGSLIKWTQDLLARRFGFYRSLGD